MQEKQQELLAIWGDTVAFKDLLVGLLLGGVLGFTSLKGGLWYLQNFHAGLEKGLMMGYGLIFGIAGCIAAGAIVAKKCKAKRILMEEEGGIDLESVLESFQINLQKEAEYLKEVPSDVITEMHQLKLYELFAGNLQHSKKGGE